MLMQSGSRQKSANLFFPKVQAFILKYVNGVLQIYANKVKMKTQLLFIVAVVTLIKCQQTTIACHYSCSACVGQSYTLCTKCVEDKNITVVQNPQLSQPEFINSNSLSGVCAGDVLPKTNPLGILMLLICIGIAIAIRTPFSIYLISTLQSIALISFVQVAWLTPVNYLLQALQYFMIFTWIGSGYKIQDQKMRQRQYFRLDLYFHQSNFLRNIAIIGIINLILVILIILLAVWKYKKDKKQRQSKFLQTVSEKNEQKLERISHNISQQLELPALQSQKKEETTMQKVLQWMLRGCLTMFYLLIQQTSLTIMVSLRFERPISLGAKGIPIIYCLCLLAFLVYVFVQKLWFFPNKQAQFLNIWRKIGLPVLCIVPYKITFLIVVFFIIFVFLQGFFQYRDNGYKLISRITIYKLLQFITILLAGAYLLTQITKNLQIQTNIIRVFLAISILAFFACFFIELVFEIIQTYCLNKNQVTNSHIDENQNKNRILNNTQQTLNNINNVQDNQNKNNIFIHDLENSEDQNKDKNKSSKDQNNKTQETDEARRRKEEEQARKRQQQQVKRRKEEQDRKQRQEEAARRRKQQQEIQKKRKQQSEALDKKLKAEQEALAKIKRQEEQLERRRKQEEQKRKQQQLARKRKEDEEAAAKRKAQLEEARKKKQEEEEAARRKKQQLQQQQEQRARKKRKYIAQMDPELRKRYGF